MSCRTGFQARESPHGRANTFGRTGGLSIMAKRSDPSPKSGAVFTVPPFPPLTNDAVSGKLGGRDTFKTWAGFYLNPSGEVVLDIDPPEEIERDVAAASKVPPQPEQIAAYRFLRESEADVTAAVLGGIFAEYPKLREFMGANKDNYPHDKFPMPVVKAPAELKRLIGPKTFTVLAYGKGGVAYVGMEFRCTWDPEHRVGVMTHMSRVLAVGEGDMSFDLEVPKNDGGRPLTLR